MGAVASTVQTRQALQARLAEARCTSCRWTANSGVRLYQHRPRLRRSLAWWRYPRAGPLWGYVAKGGSARTAACLLRRTFRNWFQPRYPYVYATFRCVST